MGLHLCHFRRLTTGCLGVQLVEQAANSWHRQRVKAVRGAWVQRHAHLCTRQPAELSSSNRFADQQLITPTEHMTAHSGQQSLGGAVPTLPVFGCTQKGALSRWFIFLDTSMSRRGNVYARTMRLGAARTSVLTRDSAPLSPLFFALAWRCHHIPLTSLEADTTSFCLVRT
jgi:hypothetical protein